MTAEEAPDQPSGGDGKSILLTLIVLPVCLQTIAAELTDDLQKLGREAAGSLQNEHAVADTRRTRV